MLRRITQYFNCVNTQDILKKTARYIKRHFQDITLESLSNLFQMVRECDYFLQRTEIKATVKAIMGSNSLYIFFLSVKFNKLCPFWLGMSDTEQYKNYTLSVLHNFWNVVFLAHAEHY